MADTGWAATPHNVPAGAYYSPRVHVTGPGLESMTIEMIVSLADAVHGRGPAADAWDAYTTARLNHDAAREFGAEDVDEVELEAAEACALTDVLEALNPTLSLTPADATVVELLLNRATRGALHESGRGSAT